MKNIFLLFIAIMILGCHNHSKTNNRNEFTIYSVKLFKRGMHNADLLTCCFETTQPSIFLNKLKEFPIKKVDFPMTEQLGLNFYGWKVQKYDLDSTCFVLGLFINNSQISNLSDDSIRLLTQKLVSDPSITIILENNDSIILVKKNAQSLKNMKAVFSLEDTTWRGIDYW